MFFLVFFAHYFCGFYKNLQKIPCWSSKKPTKKQMRRWSVSVDMNVFTFSITHREILMTNTSMLQQQLNRMDEPWPCWIGTIGLYLYVNIKYIWDFPKILFCGLKTKTFTRFLREARLISHGFNHPLGEPTHEYFATNRIWTPPLPRHDSSGKHGRVNLLYIYFWSEPQTISTYNSLRNHGWRFEPSWSRRICSIPTLGIEPIKNALLVGETEFS